jgi:hypothetical protein
MFLARKFGLWRSKNYVCHGLCDCLYHSSVPYFCFINSGSKVCFDWEKTMKHRADKKRFEPEYVGVDDAEIMSGLSRWTWRSWAYSGRVTSVKAGRRLLIPVTEIRGVMDEGTRPRVLNVI